jgi:uncharacterized membrane protein YecN with MAPEG domain
MTDHLTFLTPLYAGFFGIMLVILSWRVSKLKRKYDNHKMNEGGHTELSAAVRAQANIVEYLPIALLLMWMLESMQFSTWIINTLGILLIIARLMHLHGLNEPSGNGPGRKLGTRLTWLHIVVCSLLGFAGAFGVVV